MPPNFVVRACLASALVSASFVAQSSDLLGFSSPDAYVLLGTGGGTSVPPLSLLLDGPAPFDTFVSITSTEPSVAEVIGGGIMFPAGTSSALVLISAFSLGETTLTAALGPALANANLFVVTEIPAIPEPSTYLLLAAGIAGVLLRRRVRSSYTDA